MKNAWRCGESIYRRAGFNFHVPERPKTGYGWKEGDRDYCTECLRPIVYAHTTALGYPSWEGWRWVRICEIIEWP